MKRLFFILIIALSLPGLSQNYNTAIGVRAGNQSGLTIKHFMGSDKAIEGILSFYYHNGATLTGLWTINKKAFDVDRLNWSYGLGVHVGFWDDEYYYYHDHYNHMSLGIDGILGLEYTIKEIPFNIGIDIKPFFDVYEHAGFYGAAALSIRYILK